MWYFDEEKTTCFAYPVNCYTPVRISAQLYSTEEECSLKHMALIWKRYTLSCPFSLQLVVFTRSNGDHMPYIFSPSLCRKSGGRLRSDICTSAEFCYLHRHFAFCCNSRAFAGKGPAGGSFTVSGIGGPKKHLVRSVISSPPQRAPADCNTYGDRREVEWYPRDSMTCVARRSDCLSPGFPVDAANFTYPSLQLCMDAHFANWMMSYKMTCSRGYAPVTNAGSPLIFSKTLCGSWHHSDVCNHDEYCSFNNRSVFAFCCRRSDDDQSTVRFVIYGNEYRRQRNKRQVKFIEL